MEETTLIDATPNTQKIASSTTTSIKEESQNHHSSINRTRLSPTRKMSKFKISLTKSLLNLLRLCLPLPKDKKQYFLLFTFFKSFRSFLPEDTEEKAFKYWARQTLPETITIADRMFEEERYMEVYEMLNRIRYSKEVEVLWRIARALYNLSFERAVTQEEKSEMMKEALELLKVAAKAGETTGIELAEVHKWMAVILDAKFGLVNLQARVRNSYLIKKHLTKAVELNPVDFTAQYMLGKWCFEMSRLSWIQRMLAKYFIAWEPPQCSYQEAFTHLSRAEQIQPRAFLPNIYLLGRTCIEIGQFYKAKYYLNVCVNLPPRDDCERCCVQKARHLIKKLDRYDLGKTVLFYDYPFGFTD